MLGNILHDNRLKQSLTTCLGIWAWYILSLQEVCSSRSRNGDLLYVEACNTVIDPVEAMLSKRFHSTVVRMLTTAPV